MSGRDSPSQHVLQGTGLTLAHDELLGIAKRQQPPLAAHGAHLPYVIHVHNRVPVYTLERRILEMRLDLSK